MCKVLLVPRKALYTCNKWMHYYRVICWRIRLVVLYVYDSFEKHTSLVALYVSRWIVMKETEYFSAALEDKPTCQNCEGSQMLFYVWFEFTSWLRGVGQGKGAWDCFLTIWAWDSCAFCQWDQWLLRDWTFILQMTLSWPDVDSLGLLPSALMFCLNLKKSPSSNPDYKDTL